MSFPNAKRPDEQCEIESGRAEKAIVLRNAALRLLVRRDHSAAELTRKLTQRGHRKDLIQSVVEQLQSSGILSDARFTEVFVHARINRGQGPMRIRRDLYERGIAENLIEDHLTGDADFWLAQAARVREKKFAESLPENRSDWNRQARFLANRGFSTDVIYQLMRR